MCDTLVEIEIVDPAGRCEICQALESLRATMERKGTRHPELFDPNRMLPPGDK